MARINVVKPMIDDNEVNRVVEVLRSGMLVESKNNQQLQEEFATFADSKYAVSSSNGTTALHTALEALGIQPRDEIITTPFTFIASVNSISFIGAVPKFVDINPDTFTIDPELIKKAITKKTKAIMPIHIFGLPADMPAIMDIAEDHDLVVIEDACQAHGARIGGKHVGSFGDIGCFSFYATKNMIAGEGGMIVTNNEELLERCKSLRNHGRAPGKAGGYMHHEVGYNMRITDFQAAIALEQLKKLPAMLKRRKYNAEWYRKELGYLTDVTFQKTPENMEHANYLFVLKTLGSKPTPADIMNHLKTLDIGSRPIYDVPVHKQPAYQNITNWRWSKVGVEYPNYGQETYPITELIAANHLEIPVHPGLSDEDLSSVSEGLKAYLK
jgi:perosamine synthetase